ncbi:MFS transporter [Mesorhizobium sp. BAC0120]|uniref:MFS transporter n=1 Tax=Mesorhizobium sp. BAC0120 TaxID=3090670 RepID=UPI00298C9C75|nr:MFS transporter [Mesorhizobium sp. BAC0120]MDW6020633.1 MFS transporter [Mesorhizobium sp. BAC0120]
MSAETLLPSSASKRIHRYRWHVAVLLILAFMLDLLNVTIVNVGLPAIQRDLDASVNEVGWISAAYLLAFAVALITAARLGDLWGRKRVFLCGVAAFAATGVWSGLAGSAAELIAARTAQGLSAALIVPQVMSILYGLFDDKERTAVFGIFGLVAGLAQTGGLLLGGLLVTANLGGLGWRTIFLVSVPFALLLTAVGAWLVPESRVDGAARPRWLSAAVLTAGLVAIVFPLLEGNRYGWPFWGWVLLIAGLLALAALAFMEDRRPAWRAGALLPLPFFRPRTVRAGIAILVPAFAGFSGFLLVFALWLQDGQGYSPLQAGLVTVAFSAGGLAMALFVGRLTMRFGRMVVLAGCLAAATGALAVLGAALLGLHTLGLWSLVPGLFLFGVGINMVMPPLTSLFLSAVPPDNAGSASGIWTTAQQIPERGSKLLPQAPFGRLRSLAAARAGC